MCSDSCLWLSLEACTVWGGRKRRKKKCVWGGGGAGCGGVGVGKPTGLQVQTEVEERAVSERAQQVVAAFEGGH